MDQMNWLLKRAPIWVPALIVSLGLSACANGPCRQLRNPELAKTAGAAPTAAQPAAPAGATPSPNLTSPNLKGGAVSDSATTQERTVFVYKPDGSLQCGMGKAIPVEEMEKQLSGIRVHSRQNRPDGLMHIQVCGSPTGMINVYEIPATALKEAEGRGFKKLESR